MRTGSRLLVIEQVLTEETTTDPFARFLDLHMPVIHGDREKRGEVLLFPLTAAGFRTARARPTATGLQLVKATAR